MAWWEELSLGIKVTKDAAAIAIDASPGEPFFTVAGGWVRLTGLLGYCTVAPGANNCQFCLAPDAVGAAVTVLSLAFDIDPATEGDLLTITGDPGVAMVGGHVARQQMMAAAPAGVVLSPGVIGFIADAAEGTYRWVLWYKPIDDGATVTVI
uniref:Uncharacterized protein n=1 Tax=viral metagenome TaxID=1070528 RepID=A0A6H1Z7M5_9ZZZZ